MSSGHSVRVLMLAMLFSVGVPGCFASWVPYKPLQFQTTASQDNLYAATVRVFARHGFGLVSRDPVARVVETQWIEWPDLVGPGGRRVSVSYRVMVNHSSIEIFTSCDDCQNGMRPDGLHQRQEDYFAEILAEVKKL